MSVDKPQDGAIMPKKGLSPFGENSVSESTPEPSNKPLFTCNEAADFWERDRGLVRRAVKEGQIPAIFIGRRWYIPGSIVRDPAKALEMRRDAEPRLPAPPFRRSRCSASAGARHRWELGEAGRRRD